jgi:nicotinamide mononucleotide (NMN) deamidase PncC
MVQFVVQEGSRIAALASSIIGGVANIAKGNITGAVQKVESGLAQAIPLALSFLSKIFRVSGIGTKIKAIIQKVKGKIDAVTKKVMDKVAAAVAKVVGAMATGANKVKDATVNGVKKLINGVFGKKSFKAGKEQHSVWVDVKNGEPELWIASTPREAGQQLAEIRKEATTKGFFPTIEPSWKAAQEAVTNARAKLKDAKNDTTLTDEKRKSRENDIKKRMTDIVNGAQHSIKDVLEQLEQNGGDASDLKVNLDAKVLRAELWASGRPGWAKKTLDQLIKDYPWAFDANGNVKQDAIGRPMYDRRHIVAFDKIIDTEVAQLNGKMTSEASAYLTRKGAKLTPKKNRTNNTVDITSIKTSLKTHLALEFNQVTNLWVGDAAKNQEIGRLFAEAQRRRAKLKPGTLEFEAESKRVAENQVDVEGGKTGGRSLSADESQAISDVISVETSMPDFESSKDDLKKMFMRQTPRNGLYTRAVRAQEILVESMGALRKASRTNNSGKLEANTLTQKAAEDVRSALNRALQYETRLNEILRKG